MKQLPNIPLACRLAAVWLTLTESHVNCLVFGCAISAFDVQKMQTHFGSAKYKSKYVLTFCVHVSLFHDRVHHDNYGNKYHQPIFLLLIFTHLSYNTLWFKLNGRQHRHKIFSSSGNIHLFAREALLLSSVESW